VTEIPWSDTVTAGIVAILRAGIADKLQALEIERGEPGVPLEVPDPADIFASDKVEVHTVPAIEVWCNDSARNEANQSALEYRHRCVVSITVAGTDEEVLDKQVKRSLLAILMLLDGQRVADCELICGGFTYLLAEGDEERPFARSGAMEVTATTLTDYF
jgi:hypothetical protein